jgi:hypothetical protein
MVVILTAIELVARSRSRLPETQMHQPKTAIPKQNWRAYHLIKLHRTPYCKHSIVPSINHQLHERVATHTNRHLLNFRVTS